MFHADAAATLPRTVTLYARSGCSHCEQAAEWLRDWSAELGFALNEVDIDRDAALLAAYDWLVPVVAVGAVEVARAPLQRSALRQRLGRLLDGAGA